MQRYISRIAIGVGCVFPHSLWFSAFTVVPHAVGNAASMVRSPYHVLEANDIAMPWLSPLWVERVGTAGSYLVSSLPFDIATSLRGVQHSLKLSYP